MQYAYDALHRLTTATENGTFVLVSATYDPLSRVTGVAKGNGLNQYTQVTKGANPTVTLAYDASGNLTGDSTWTFAYDAENKLRSASKSGTAASYAYDPLLRREGKTVNGTTTTFLLDGAEEIGEYDGNGAMLRRYVPSNTTDAPIATIEGTGGSTVRKWFHRNRLGSTIAMSDGAGAVSEGPITYDAFGNSTSTGGVAFKYAGRKYDSETGLYYYRARYYSSSLGRFMQTDPIGTCDQMNLYAYVDNDPMNHVDPFGLSSTEISTTGTTIKPKEPWPVERIRVIGQRSGGHYRLENIGPNYGAAYQNFYGSTSEYGGGGRGLGYGAAEDEDEHEGKVERVVVVEKRLHRFDMIELMSAGRGQDLSFWEDRYGRMQPGETCASHCKKAVGRLLYQYVMTGLGGTLLRTMINDVLKAKDAEMLLDVVAKHKGTVLRRWAAARFIGGVALGTALAAAGDYTACVNFCPGK